MRTIKRIIDGFNRLIYAFHLIAALLILPAMVVLIGLDVTMRYVTTSPISWGQEATSLLLAVSIMLGLSYAWTRRVHVRMEILFERGGDVFQGIGDVLTCLCGVLLFGMIGWQAWRDIPFMRMFGERTEELGLALWPFRLFLFAVCALLCVQMLFSTIASIRARLLPADR